MRWNKLILLLTGLLAGSCVDRFIPETAGYDKVLFIECLLSDAPGNRAVVHVSLSAPIATEEGGRLTHKPEGLSGALVSLECSDGTIYVCNELQAGTYLPYLGFKAEAGKSYKLAVEYDHNRYESDFEKIRQSPPIDSISFKPVSKKVSEAGGLIEGYRFYANTHGEGTEPEFYRWAVEATYRYEAPYTASHVWDGKTQIQATNREFRTCWKTKLIPGLFISKTTGLNENRILEAPLNFESQMGDELSVRYSLNVKQYMINESAMRFWEEVRQLETETGSLYETQPFRIQGNIRCTTDPSLYVTGVFEVAGYSSARIFVDQPTEFTVTPVRCMLQLVGGLDLPWYRLPIGSFLTQDFETGGFYTASPGCYDCRKRSGTIEKPPFWIDK